MRFSDVPDVQSWIWSNWIDASNFATDAAVMGNHNENELDVAIDCLLRFPYLKETNDSSIRKAKVRVTVVQMSCALGRHDYGNIPLYR